MKRLYIILLISCLGFSHAQETNINQLKALQEKFQQIDKKNNEFKAELAAKKGISVDALNKSLVGKIGRFLTYIEELDSDQVLATNADFLYNNTIADVAVSGEGMKIYQWDGGRVEITHQEFEGRVSNLEPNSVEISDHSTAIAGIMVAAGIQPEAVGTAPEASVISYDYDSNFDEIAQESINNPDYMTSNHSYGYRAGWRWGEYDDTIGEGWYWFGYPSEDENESLLYGIYSPLDQSLDELAIAAPNHLMIKAAGNDRNNGPASSVEHAFLNDLDEWEQTTGYRPANCEQTGFDCISYGSIAKNILLVGSINQISNTGRYTGPDSITPSSFSSFGPTDDGRIKPDIVSQGSSVYTPKTGNAYYPEVNGTSASTPSVTAIATLLQQLYYELHSEYMNASQLKALLLNTTNETGDSPGPDYQYGYGLVDAFQAANLIVNDNNNQAIILKDVKADEENRYDLVATGNGPIKATLVWIDPAIDANALPYELNNRMPILVNDLDMRIIENASSTSFLPWTLDVENPSEAAVPGDNILDNVEQIVIQAPTSTLYTLTVNHKDLLESDEQYYAIVISGATLATQRTNKVNKEETISIYPNPVKDILYVKGLDLNQNNHIKIYTTQGQLVTNTQIQDGKIDVTNLTKGVYMIVIKNEKTTYVDKFIKN